MEHIKYLDNCLLTYYNYNAYEKTIAPDFQIEINKLRKLNGIGKITLFNSILFNYSIFLFICYLLFYTGTLYYNKLLLDEAKTYQDKVALIRGNKE